MRHRSFSPLVPPSRLVALLVLAGCQTYQPTSTVNPDRAHDSVAIGYGSQAKRDLTGSIGSVSGDVARRNSPTTMADMIDARFAGVEVRRLASGGMSVRIRGQHTLKGDGEPLYVVDGIPQHVGSSGVLNDIDPRSVQSIEVLKDAGTTAAYGARGANGVILITTKRPE
jgi:TonB-dependent SusC/RagA subfamily outer membrane receptor